MFLHIENSANQPAMAPKKACVTQEQVDCLSQVVTLKWTGLMYGLERRCKVRCPDSPWKKDVFAELEVLRMWETWILIHLLPESYINLCLWLPWKHPKQALDMSSSKWEEVKLSAWGIDKRNLSLYCSTWMLYLNILAGTSGYSW